MPKIADRVKELTTTTGTGTVNLAGAVTGFRAFSSAFTTGDVVYYCIEDTSGNWEIGSGAVTTGSPWTLARTTIYSSSNSGSAVSFGAGNKTVSCVKPSEADVFMGALVNKSVDQTTADYTTATTLTWDAEVYDTHTFHDNVTSNTRLTIPSGYGITKVILSTGVDVSQIGAVNYDINLAVLKNNNVAGIGLPYIRLATSATAGLAGLQLTTPPLSVTDGDYFEARLYFRTDTSITVEAERSWFSMPDQSEGGRAGA